MKSDQADGCGPATPLVPEKNIADGENHADVDSVKPLESDMEVMKPKKRKGKGQRKSHEAGNYCSK